MLNNLSELTQELNELIENVTKERNRFNENQILTGVVFDSTKASSNLNSGLRTKIRNIALAYNVEEYMDLNLRETNLLGIDVSRQTELNYEEREALKECVEKGIILKSNKLTEVLGELGITMVNTKLVETRLALDLSPEEKASIDLKKSLNEKQNLTITKLEELLEVYENIVDLRTRVLPKLADQVSAYCEIQKDVYCLKSEMIRASVRIDIFTEEKESLDFYKLILKNSKRQQEECKAEIEKLKVLKEKYTNVSCKQFDEILRSYLKYKRGVDIKRGFVNPLTM